MATHELKVWPEFFGALERGEKLFELRKDDRDFEVGDWLKLREWKPADIANAQPAGYTGARVLRQIAYVLESEGTERLREHFEGHPQPGPVLRAGYVILGLAAPISELPCRLKGRRIFVEGVDPAVAREAGEYLIDLTAFVDRMRAQHVKDKRELKNGTSNAAAAVAVKPGGPSMAFEVDEEERQAIVLALAVLARERAGWANYLRAIAAEKFHADALFTNVSATLGSKKGS